MADLKISQLTAATTPLAGTEVLPIVQSGQTTQVSVANLTAGRTVSAFRMKVGAGAASNTSSLMVNTPSGTAAGLQLFQDGIESWIIGMDASDGALKYKNSGSLKWSIGTAGDATLALGNVVMGTAARGINFTANTPAAGMTSQLLNWYEEGTWTPALARSGGGLTYTPGASDRGYYTRVGNLVSVHLIISGTWTGGSGGYQVTGLPFAVAATPYSTSTGVFANLSTGGAPALTFIAASGTTTADVFGTPVSGEIIVCSATYRV